MATKKETQSAKLTAAQAREKVVELQEKLDTFNQTSQCPMCRKHKNIEKCFYKDTDPLFGGESFSRICRDCARKIALRVDINGKNMNQQRNLFKKHYFI